MGANDNIGGKLVGIGGTLLLVNNLMWFGLPIASMVAVDSAASGAGFGAFDSIFTMMYLAFTLDIISFLLIGIGGILIWQGVTTEDYRYAQAAMLFGIMSILWAIFAMLWRFIIPMMFFGLFLDAFDAEPTDVERAGFLIFVFMTLNFILLPVVFYCIRNFFNLRTILEGSSKSSALFTALIIGGGISAMAGLMISGTFGISLMGGDVGGESAAGIMILALFLKVFIVPIIVMIGSIGLIKGGFNLGSMPIMSGTPAGGMAGPGGMHGPGQPYGYASSLPRAGSPRLGDYMPPTGPRPGPGPYSGYGHHQAEHQEPHEDSSPSGEGPPCNSCDRPTEYIEQYDRYYCRGCAQYAPEDARPHRQAPGPSHPSTPSAPSRPSPTPRPQPSPSSQSGPSPEMSRPGTSFQLPRPTSTSAISDYQEATSSSPAAGGAASASRGGPSSLQGGSDPNCRNCGKAATYIEQYDRYYCHPCQEYV